MRVKVLKFICIKPEFEHLKKLVSEKGEFSLGQAFFSSEGKLAVICSFKGYDPQLAEVNDFHASQIVKKNKTLEFTTLQGNYVKVELL